jgi:hypothetical protein
MTPQLAQALQSTAILGAVIRPLLVATLLAGLWLALARARLDVRRRVRAWSTVAAVLVAWLATVWTLAWHGSFTPAPGTPAVAAIAMILAPTALSVAVALWLLVRRPAIVAAIDAAPLWWLVAYQAYRVAGFVFLRLWTDGFVPGFFAVPAGVGDMLTGLLAIAAAVALARHSPRALTFAYAVNMFGIADLGNAISLAALSTAMAGAGPSPLLTYPLPIVPTFGVPLAFIVHCLSLWQLRRRARAPSPQAGRAGPALHGTA